MTEYRLVISTEADQDLDRIYTEGFINWGEAQADHYYDNLIQHFDTLCHNPYLYQAVDHIRLGYRRSVCGKHSVFYRINDQCIEIMALVKYEDRP